METRANHLFIGAFVLVVVVGMIGFVAWLAKVDIDREFNAYHIFFEGSVTGLSSASNVLYRGIPVGTVNEVIIDPDDSSRVRVTVEVASNTPIREDSVATLELQGITGASLIQITGGSADSPELVAKSDQTLPVIRSKPSSFQQLFAGAPELLTQLVVLTSQAVDLLNEDNRRSVKTILADASEVSGALARKSDSFGRILGNIEEATFEMREASAGVNDLVTTLESNVGQLADSADATLSVARGTLTGLDQVVAQDLRLVLADARQTAQSVTETSQLLNAMVAENREPIGDFATDGLYELSGMISDMRVLMTGLSRLADRLESDPTQFFFGSSEQGFEAE